MMNLRVIFLDAIAGVRRRQGAARSFRRANKLYQAGDFGAAIEGYNEAVAGDPERAVIRFNLGLALYKHGEKAAARIEWKNVLELAEGKNAYLTEQAQIMLRQFG